MSKHIDRQGGVTEVTVKHATVIASTTSFVNDKAFELSGRRASVGERRSLTDDDISGITTQIPWSS